MMKTRQEKRFGFLILDQQDFYLILHWTEVDEFWHGRTFFKMPWRVLLFFESCACILKKNFWLSSLAFSKNHSSETDKAMFIGQDLNLVVEVSIDITVLLGIEPRDKVLAQIMIFWNDFNYWSNFLN